jgi:hypothetical protein
VHCTYKLSACCYAVTAVAVAAGALFQVANFHFNLNHFSNALTIWLGMHPSTIFFQIFLPPLLLDSAVRLDFFLFKKVQDCNRFYTLMLSLPDIDCVDTILGVILQVLGLWMSKFSKFAS